MAKDKDKKKKNEELNSEENAVEISGKEDEVLDAQYTSIESEEGLTLTKEELLKAQEEIAKMRKAMEEAVLDAQRIQAEFNNYRKRNASLRADSMDDGARETIRNLLPVLDNFDRALENSDGSPFALGIEQIRKQLIDSLEKSGLEQIEAEGMFDPNMHEAVMRDDEGECESGTITAVLQKGYRVRGKIVRHTMVKVKA